jgi:hypothetical protein
MIEIQPVTPSFPLVKPKKIDKDDHRPGQQPQRKKSEADGQKPEPQQHIDEIV